MSSLDFQNIVYAEAAINDRTMPWRDDTRGYYVHVSEMMLQQTQVERVIPKFNAFIKAFPDYETLAASDFIDVLQQWSGLGYNRRAKYLYLAARIIIDKYDGMLPNSETALIALPGIGKNTAAAIQAYVFNQPVAFVETNIRTVFIHHFFNKREKVLDSELLPLIEQTIDAENPREWYWAIMDYGTALKKRYGNVSRASIQYKKQSAFIGSKRELRGRIIKRLTTGSISLAQLGEQINDERLGAVIDDLVSENLLEIEGTKVSISSVV